VNLIATKEENMNAVNTDNITLEAMRRMSIQDLMKLDLETLQSLQRKADNAVVTARRAQSWIDSVIALKVREQSRNESGR
jgi:hypothetical protein